MSYEAVKTLLNKGGVARPTLYRVVMPVIKTGDAGVNDQLEFLCKAASIPEVSVNTVTALGHDAQGLTRESPSNVVFGKPFTITVISDANYTVYKGLRRWFNSIAPFGGANPQGGGALARQRIAYYDEVVADITIFKEEQRMRNPFTVRLNNAYPVNMGTIDLASDAYDQALEYQVQFYYETLTFIGQNSKGDN